MTRRSPPPKRRAETDFPVKVKIKVPPDGFGQRLDVINAWLAGNLDRKDFDHHSDGMNLSGQVTAYYFRTTEIADRFVAELDVELADSSQRIVHAGEPSPYGVPNS